MATIDSIKSLSSSDLLSTKNQTQNSGSGIDFSQKLKEALNGVNELQVDGEKAMSDIASGSVKDLHQAAIAIGKAEISMKLMLEVRNKALSAYKEITRMQM